MELSIPVNIYHHIAKIHEYKGKQELYVENYPDVLEQMVDVAKIQSTKSSNAIEGIYTNDARLKELMNQTAEPQNRNEEEIAGYRHVFDLIHENYDYIEFNKNDILTLRAIATTYKARQSDEVAAELAAQQSQAQGDSENGQANSEQK